MGFTSLFVEMDEKKVLVIGSGEVGQRRAKRFKQEGAEVIIYSKNPPKDLQSQGFILKSEGNVEELIKWADIVIVASGDRNFNEEVAYLAKDKLVNRADSPEKGNLIVPNAFYVGDIQISLFTGGKSPLMAKQLRKRIQSLIKDEDILKIELQDYARNLLNKKIKKQKDRRKYLYELSENQEINDYISENDLKSAKLCVENFINNLNNE